MKLIICLASLLAASTSLALDGTVVGVHDGDTITVLDNENTQHKIRLAEIDAPELKQAWGMASKKTLSDFVFKKTVRVSVESTDRYGREVGTVFVGSENINYAQLKVGSAWAYQKYLHSKTPIELEKKAKDAKLGLWSLNEAIPPWEFRKTKDK